MCLLKLIGNITNSLLLNPKMACTEWSYVKTSNTDEEGIQNARVDL